MWLTHLLFIFETSVMAAISIAKDPNTWRHPLQLLGSLARLPKSPFLTMRAPKMLAPYDSISPRAKPPMSAPRRLPIPPSTAAVKALIPSRNPMLYWVTSKKVPNSRAATPAISPPRMNVSTMTRSMFTPIRTAISGS